MNSLGLYPKSLVEGGGYNRPYNPRALEAPFVRAANAVLAPFRSNLFPRDAQGNIMAADQFGFGGYSVPIPDELRLKAGQIYGNQMQMITEPVWHILTYTSGTTTELAFFNAQTAGLTGNMAQAGAFGYPISFILRVPRCQLNTYASTGAGGIPAVWNDQALAVLNSTQQLLVIDKISFRIPSWMLPGGSGIGGAAAGTFTAEEVVAIGSHGVADPRAVYVLLDPIWFEPQVSFRYTVTWGTAQTFTGGNQFFCIMFDGQKVRPVQ